jgi:hypothetical protein
VRVEGSINAGGEIDERAPDRRRIAVPDEYLPDVEDEGECEPLVALGEPRVVVSRIVIHPATVPRQDGKLVALAQPVNCQTRFSQPGSSGNAT